MQPYIFPYIGYFQLINAVDKFVFYDDVKFIKKGFINRNYVLVNNSKKMFTVPCNKISQNKNISEIFVQPEPKRINKILSMIEHSYKKAPYYPKIFPIIESVFLKIGQSITISRLAILSIKEVCDYLKINCCFEVSSEFYPETKNKGKIERIIKIASLNHAITYINMIGGKDIYDKEYFFSEGIKLNFLKTNKIIYKQFEDNFHPLLSIIDVLMFNSKEEVKKMVNNYQII
tara:strand:- start:1851 stop:2543 length:693 start_codon:yes stop_codon:yes gene_type:complete